MRLDACRLSIDVPDAFEDRTSYAFEEPFNPGKEAPPDRLSIGFEPLPESVAPADMTAHLRRALEKGGGGPSVLSEGRVKAGSAEAATLSVTTPDAPGGAFVAALRWPGGLMATLRYESSRPDGAAVFELVVASIRPIGVRAKPPPGLVRRRAGRLWLEVPDDLVPPSAFHFATAGEQARLLVSKEAGGAGAELDLESFIDHSMDDSFEIEKLHEGEGSVDGQPLVTRAWCVDRVEEPGKLLGSTWFSAAWVSFADGASTRLLMIETGSPEAGDACWSDLIAGLRLAAAP